MIWRTLSIGLSWQSHDDAVCDVLDVIHVSAMDEAHTDDDDDDDTDDDIDDDNHDGTDDGNDDEAI